MQSLTVNLAQPPLYPAFVASTNSTSDFHERLAALRKQRGLTQRVAAARDSLAAPSCGALILMWFP